MTGPKIAMLGLGSMNGAILTGLLSSGVSPEQVVATSRSSESAQRRSQHYGVQVLAEENDDAANRTAAAQAEIVFLGVKPYQITDLCAGIKDALKPGAVVVSVAAAVTLEMMEAALAEGQPVIRTMPNTPLSVGAGVVGLSAGTHTSQQQVELVAELLGASGSVHVIPEEQIDALSAIAGSGPAYAFYLAEQMAAAGAELGLDPELAAGLAAETIYGAGKMLLENQGKADAAQLRRNVTSPNGTTEQAISTFDAADMGQTIRAGAAAAAARAAEITGQLRGQ
ncbi:pyrroline-5-carboxylate reductase [Nesterenkonia alkaliphila]|uniref:Pyrroline-5-carboxylate reductase n=1 Tax=Nesterenkonia alkaliphila TaxID=1463631 RepID=A0A7K1UEU3_9MICC|nr:pyrroline-5-carboxylate reductase [Nesterenkonia alkaliphila]MVT24995.1 pyrroline-5-carboxylate reductase [Nesterenkonia alkaliphila]GFZ87105.1 pyrroline-5-carboxylate reductase [Nesterenkonia alkaliphila]